MKVILFSLLLPLLILSFFGCSPKNKSPLVEGLRENAAKAEPEQKACSAYSEERSPGEPANYDLPFHESREAALAILAFLEKRPLEHPFTDRVRTTYLSQLEHLAKEPDQIELTVLYESAGAVCGLFHMLHFPQLFGDQAKYIFSAAERARVERVARQFLQESLELPNSILSRAIQAIVLKKYVEAGYKGNDKEWLIEELRALLDRFEVERREIMSRSRDAKLLYGEHSVLAFEYEQNVMQRMTYEYARLVKRVFKPKA